LKRGGKGEGRPVPFPELSEVEKRIRERLAGVHPLAPIPIDRLYRPLPPGVDHRPSAFFLLASRSLGMNARDLLPFACSLESLSMAFRALLSLAAFRDDRMPRDPVRRQEEGMSLLVADGLILLAFRFLADLEAEAFRKLPPLLVRWTRDRIGGLHEVPGEGDRLLDTQRSLLTLALKALWSMIENRPARLEKIAEMAERVDALLSSYRDAGTANARQALLVELRDLSYSLPFDRKMIEPLSHYVSLILSTLGPTS